MPLRETRRFKTKGFAISFGDFMLPLVGLVAIGLLFTAGKIFLFTEFQAGSEPIPISVAPPDIPKPPVSPETLTPRADAGERVNEPSSDARRDGNDNSVQGNADPAGQGANPPSAAKEEPEVVVVTIPIPVPEPEPQPQPQPQPQQETEPARAQPVQPQQVRPVTIRQQPAQTQPQAQTQTQVNPEPAPRPAVQSNRSNWMVQVGAYSTRAAAETVSKEVVQAGYTATVVSGRLHKVLIQAGSTRQEALNLAARLRPEFPGAFIVPPGP